MFSFRFSNLSQIEMMATATGLGWWEHDEVLRELEQHIAKISSTTQTELLILIEEKTGQKICRSMLAKRLRKMRAVDAQPKVFKKYF